jgi:16S rRNA processing protein RimM
MKNNRHIIVGKIGSTYGIHGWLKVHAYTEFSTDILNYKPWYLSFGNDSNETVEAKPYKVEDGRIHGNSIIVKFAGINSPEEGRLLTGATIYVERSQLPPLKDNEYYWSDLIGLTVINKNGERLGKVIYLMATGSNDVLIVKGEKEFAIPYLLDKVILNVDLSKQEIYVDWELL